MSNTNKDKIEELSDKIDNLSNKFDIVNNNFNRNIGFYSKFENGMIVGGIIGLILYAIFRKIFYL